MEFIVSNVDELDSLGIQLGKMCKENDAVLILDEVQSGYGRSGKFFAHQEFDMIFYAL